MDIISQYFKFIYIIIPISIISLKFIYQKKYAYIEEFEGKKMTKYNMEKNEF